MKWRAERLLDTRPPFPSPLPDIPHHPPTFEGHPI